MSESADVDDRTIAVILFDMDGVVRSADREVLAREEAKLGLDPQVLKAALTEVPALWEAATIGRISDSEFRQSVRALVASSFGEAVADARARIHRDAQRPNRELMALIERLRTRYSVGVVSNATSRLEDDLVRLGLHENFDAVVVSALVGMRKPDPGIYLEAARRFNAAPQQCVLVDDSQTNVDGATAVGMHAFLFVDTPTLVRDLEGLMCGEG